MMKNILLTALAALGTFTAFSADISDYCGEFQCNYIDEWNNHQLKYITIAKTATEGKVTITGLYSPPSIGSAVIEADIDMEAGTLTLPFTDLSVLTEGLWLYRATWNGEGYSDLCKDPIVAHLDGDSIVFDENDVLMFGGYHADEDEWYILSSLRSVKFSPKKDLTFVYNEDEWEEIGTAQYPDLCFGYKIFGSRIPEVTTVKVARNKENPKRLALLNPYKSDKWNAVNRDREGVGQIVLDITDPYFVIIEPFVYSGFDYNFGGLNLGKTYVYNEEGYYTHIAGLTREEARTFLLNAGNYLTTFTGNAINCPAGVMLFAVEKNPTTKYSFGDIEGYIEFDADVMKALEEEEVEEPDPTPPDPPHGGVDTIVSGDAAAAEYFDMLGRKVSHPIAGEVYICRKGGKATKVIF